MIFRSKEGGEICYTVKLAITTAFIDDFEEIK